MARRARSVAYQKARAAAGQNGERRINTWVSTRAAGHSPSDGWRSISA